MLQELEGRQDRVGLQAQREQVELLARLGHQVRQDLVVQRVPVYQGRQDHRVRQELVMYLGRLVQVDRAGRQVQVDRQELEVRQDLQDQQALPRG